MSNSAKTRPAHDQVLSILDDLDSFAPLPTNSASAKANSPNNNKSSAAKANSTNNNKSIAKTSPSASTSAPPTSENPKIISPTSTTNPNSSHNPANSGDAQSVLDFIDEITQRSATPTPSIATKKLAGSQSSNRPISRKPSTASIGPRSVDTRAPEQPEPSISSGPSLSPAPTTSWGWGSVLKQATSTVFNQAKSAAGQVQSVVSDPSKSSELVKNLNSNLQNQLSGQSEAAKKWKEGVMGYVKASGIDQLGKDLQATGIKSLTDILNMVAPPISKHEIIDVQLSYDMVGYDGIETLVYRSLAKVMEQVDGGELVLNKGDEERAKTPESGEPERDLQAVEGMVEGYKLALANLEQMIKRIEAKKAETESNSTVEDPSKQPAESNNNNNNQLPITHCPVYVRIQPILSRLPVFSSPSIPAVSVPDSTIGGIQVNQEQHLFFLILLRDVRNSLDHATLTQSTPASWLDIPFEENEWVEDVLVEVIRRGVEIIGQQYVNGRISGRSVRNTAAPEVSSEAELPTITQP